MKGFHCCWPDVSKLVSNCKHFWSNAVLYDTLHTYNWWIRWWTDFFCIPRTILTLYTYNWFHIRQTTDSEMSNQLDPIHISRVQLSLKTERRSLIICFTVHIARMTMTMTMSQLSHRQRKKAQQRKCYEITTSASGPRDPVCLEWTGGRNWLLLKPN